MVVFNLLTSHYNNCKRCHKLEHKTFLKIRIRDYAHQYEKYLEYIQYIASSFISLTIKIYIIRLTIIARQQFV